MNNVSSMRPARDLAECPACHDNAVAFTQERLQTTAAPLNPIEAAAVPLTLVGECKNCGHRFVDRRAEARPELPAIA
jgi:DNA-directed RNA polymerase subunit M/transcription elongation factor TFIIS